jgi:hypothetical protein
LQDGGRSCNTNRMRRMNMEHMLCSASELCEGQVPETLQGFYWEGLSMALQWSGKGPFWCVGLQILPNQMLPLHPLLLQ